ncbi:MAG TPA: C25 family cysteine peptidase, partial [Bacteroidales bacterium]|nr:C25 family cysteine peptidase [Bacteroidales bacterium]
EMKKFFILLILLCLAKTIFSQSQTINFSTSEKNIWQLINNETSSFRVKVSLPYIEIQSINTQNGNFTQINNDALAIIFDTGRAQLPTINHLIEMPSENLSINIISEKKQIIKLSDYGFIYPIIPAQPSISKSIDPKTVPFYYDNNYYNTDLLYKKPIAEVEYQGKQRGVGIGLLKINPFAYNPVKNYLEVTYEVEIEVVFDTKNINNYKELKNKFYSPFFKFSKLLNYQENYNKDVITSYPITYVIVAPQSYASTLQPFIRWKTEKGYNVIVGYTDVIGSSTTNIKNYLQNLYTNTTPPPTFLLLVGDIDGVPAYNGTTQNSHVTDLYYACYDGSSDYLPDLYYARFSAQNTTQLQNIINKTMTYEKYQMPMKSYLDTVVMVAGVDASNAPTYANGQINYGTQNYFNSSNGIYSHTYLYPASDNSGASADMISKISHGTGYANYTAHCSSDGWADPSFSISNISSLQNTYKYGLMVGNCCQSSKFEVSECFGEAITRVANKGAVAYIGASDYSYWNEDYYWGVGYRSSITANPTYNSSNLGAYDRVFHTHGEPYSDWFITNAEMVHGGNLAVQGSNSSMKQYYWEIYHLFGDPSTMNYFSVPDPLNISYDEPLMIGDNSLTVNTEPYTLVALSLNGTLLAAQYSNTNNSVNLTFSDLASDDSLLIVATKQNKIPYIEKIEVNQQLLTLDAKLSNVIEPNSSYNCFDINISPKVIIQNLSTQNLTSLTICYSYANQQTQCINWNGNLAPLGKESVTLPDFQLLNGDNNFIVYCKNPNNSNDLNRQNDTIIKNIHAEYLPISVDFLADPLSTCSAPYTVNFNNLSQNVQSFTWNFGDGNISNETTPTHTYNSNGFYTVTLTADAGLCGNFTKIKDNYIQIGNVPPIVQDTTVCEGETATLQAIANGTINWYENENDITPVFTGSYYIIPNITQQTTVWVESNTEAAIQHVGSTDSNTNGDFLNSWTSHYLIFDCYQPVTLLSVEVNANSSGNRTISLKDANNNILQSATVNIPAGVSRINLNFDLPVQNNLRLACSTYPNLYRNNANTQYPYQIANILSITGNSANDLTYYYYFYDWEIKGDSCVSERVPATVFVDICNNIELYSNDFDMYPNPASDFITIELSNITRSSLRVYSLDGRQIINLDFSSDKMTLDVSKLTNGTYLLQIINEDGISQKLFAVYH